MTTPTPGRPAEEAVPEVYRRWLRVDQPKNWTGPSDSLVGELWREKSDAQKAFWRSLDTAQEPQAAPELAAAEMVSPTNRTEASGWLNEVTGSLIDGTTDSITPVISSTALVFAMLDIADAVREQTAAIERLAGEA